MNYEYKIVFFFISIFIYLLVQSCFLNIKLINLKIDVPNLKNFFLQAKLAIQVLMTWLIYATDSWCYSLDNIMQKKY